jgi:hypothetical protein
MENSSPSITQRLFADETLSVFAILDGASVPGLLPRLHQDQPECVCLYRGELAPDLAACAPYLVHLQIETAFTEWITREGWGKHWGVFALSSSDLRVLRHHFRTLVTVYDPDAKPVLFRYYDPRVLRTYLPTCNREELGTFFGPVNSYVLEDEDGKGGLKFQIASEALKRYKF